VFYKILRELEKSHRASIIHNDIKLGNIMVNSIGPNFKFYEVQLIDWNLATFYHRGVDSSAKRGTVCYYSPEQLFGTYHITPAIDVWALAIVMFTYYTDLKPFGTNCKSNNLRAIANLVGGQKMLALYKKYRFNSIASIPDLLSWEQNPQKHLPRDIDRVDPRTNEEDYTPELRDVFRRMLEPDPELRATPEELMKMPYFRKIKSLPAMYAMKQQKGSEKVEKLSARAHK
jgi:serine/threonine protein kinase